jgi:rod shape-determining protein MreC
VLSLLKRYRELILVAVLLLVPLGVFFAHAKKASERSRVDRAVVKLTVPIERAVGWAVTGTLNGWRGYVGLRHARERAVELSRENNLLKLERLQREADRQENERLRRLLSFAEGTPSRSYLGGRIIGVRLAPSGLQILTLDRGAKDGIARMMPVVTADGVVGRVHEVSDHAADVLVLTDRNSSIAVRVDRTRARANVRGLGKPGACKLDYALRTEDIIEGDELVTSGTDGVFPRGLPVGRITQLRRSANGLFQEARVIPAVDVTRVEEALVVTSWEIPPEEPPADEGALRGPDLASSAGAGKDVGAVPAPAQGVGKGVVRAASAPGGDKSVRASPAPGAEKGVRAASAPSADKGVRAAPAPSAEKGVHAAPAPSADKGVRAASAPGADRGVRSALAPDDKP